MADRTILYVGLGMVGGAIMLGLLAAASGVDAFGGFSGTLMFFGIIVLIVGAFRGSGGGGQQQQQQVVIVQNGGDVATGPTGSPPDGGTRKQALRCPECKKLSPVDAAFCGHCGRQLGKRAAGPQ